jgi:hypothetical protein
MTEFSHMIGKKLKAVSFTTTFEGFEDFSKDNRAAFDYLPLGGLNLLFEDNTAYSIANHFHTSLGTDGVGIEKIEEFKKWPNSDHLPEKWNNKINKEITLIRIYWNTEDWNGGMKNEFYPESVEIVFQSESVFYFCGDVNDFNILENRYNLLAGRDSGLIFYTWNSFKKHNLHNVKRVEEIKAYTKSADVIRG